MYDVNNPKLRALIVRRNSDDLKDWVDRAYQEYSQFGVTKAGNPPEFKWPSGAVFRTGHLKDEQAYTKYQGHEYHRMLIEELNQIPDEESYLRLLASCRSTVKGLRPQAFLTTNPGGLGHVWVKERFVDPAPPNTAFKDKTSGRYRIYIPSTIDDNPTLLENDPDYVKSLDALQDTNPELYRAWRYGDWDIFSGQVFSEFRRDKHVIGRIKPNSDLSHFLWTDWGYSEKSAFATYASALVQMKNDDTGDVFNRVVTYQEWYGNLKTPKEWAKEIYETAQHRNFKAWIVDGAMLNPKTDGSESIVKIFKREWKELNKDRDWIPTVKPGSKNRIQRVASTHDWLSTGPDGLPFWVMTENCVNLIRTLPMLTYDEHKVEDVDTSLEDHAYDATSYGLGHVKFINVPVGTFGRKFSVMRKNIHPVPYGVEGKPMSLDIFKVKGKANKDWRAS